MKLVLELEVVVVKEEPCWAQVHMRSPHSEEVGESEAEFIRSIGETKDEING